MTESRDTPAKGRFVSLVERCIAAPSLDSSQRLSSFSVLGTAILYASAYFLPALTPIRAYLLPSYDLFGLIIWPSLIATGVVATLIYLFALMFKQWVPTRITAFAAVFGLVILTLIALKGVLEAAGYHWQDEIPVQRDLLSAQQHFKLAVTVVVFVAVWSMRKFLKQLLRLLSSLGFAFGMTAVVRLFILHGAQPAQMSSPVAPSTAASVLPSTVPTANNLVSATKAKPRRVVWVIFDELDYSRAFGGGAARMKMDNFHTLANSAVFAADAYSPASATLYSIPALISGIPIGGDGDGVTIGNSGSLKIDTQGGGSILFDQASSIFSKLASRGLSSSVLGFYHPYCKLFALQRCNSFSYYELGLDEAVWANIPDRISRSFGRTDLMDEVTKYSLKLLPEYLARDDSLTFVHLNVPHLPASYAAKVLNLPPTADVPTQYSRNLIVTDEILGIILRQVQQQTVDHELLLVVSSDHWLRNIWYQADIPDVVSRIPLIIWRVGDKEGITLSNRVNTVHTADMILDYLDGKVTTQAEIAKWWADKTTPPTYIVLRN